MEYMNVVVFRVAVTLFLGTGGEKGMKDARSVVGLVVALAICFAVAGVGSVFTARSVPTWYAELAKPSWTPPGWLFGPVWTVLYVMMAVAAWLVWRQAGTAEVGLALALFAVQLALNGLWSPVFFGLRNPGLGFGVIVLLWLAIVGTMATFWRVKPAAAWLLAPYLAWVTYASALNFAVWRMNA